eukprot:IDg20012t1
MQARDLTAMQTICCKRALSAEKELQIGQLCLRHAARGAPIMKEKLALFVQKAFVFSLNPRFKNINPGRRLI